MISKRTKIGDIYLDVNSVTSNPDTIYYVKCANTERILFYKELESEQEALLVYNEQELRIQEYYNDKERKRLYGQ